MPERDGKGRFSRGNTQARSHGARGYLAIGRMPPGCRAIRRALGTFRRALVRAVSGSEDGELSVAQAALVSTAIRQEGRARLLGWHLAKQGSSMTAEQILAFTRDIAAGTEGRDRAIRALLASAGGHEPPDSLATLLAGLGGPLACWPGDRAADAAPGVPGPESGGAP